MKGWQQVGIRGTSTVPSNKIKHLRLRSVESLSQSPSRTTKITKWDSKSPLFQDIESKLQQLRGPG